MKIKKILFIGFVILIILSASQIFANENERNLYKRTGDILREHAVYNFGLSRFLSAHFLTSSEFPSSPGNIIFYNGKQNYVLPFNYNSPDLFSIDEIEIDSIIIESNPTISENYLFPKGKIDIKKKPVSDEFKIRLRLFTGSETGDPLIYYLTRDNLEIGNINKFVPSGVVSFENSLNKFSYRFKGGYFGYYPTGSVNDGIIWGLNAHYGGKQNKQGISELNTVYKITDKKMIGLDASAVSYYGFDLSPFTSSFTHSEYYIHSIKFSAVNLIDAFEFELIKDGTNFKLTEIDLIPGAKFNLNNYRINSKINLIDKNEYSVKLFTNYDFLNAVNSDYESQKSEQNFFGNKNELSKYSTGAEVSGKINSFDMKLSFNHDFNFANKNESSIYFKTNYKLDEYNSAGISSSSVVKYPNLFEKYASFLTLRNLTDLKITDSIFIKGNTDLQNERNNFFGINYLFTKGIKFKAETGILSVKNPIAQKVESYVLTASTGDFLKNAAYENKNDIKVFTFNLNLEKSFETAEFTGSYKFSDRDEIFPKHNLFFAANVNLPISASIRTEYFFRSRSRWSEFDAGEFSNSYIERKYNQNLSPASVFNISYIQKLSNFYFFENLSFKFEIENLFDKKFKMMPNGNEFRRAVVIYLNAMI